LCDAATAPVLAAALRANATLTSLTLNGVLDVWRRGDVAAALLGALTGHGSLRTLRVTQTGGTALVHRLENAPPLAPEAVAVSVAALGALNAANAAALTALDVSDAELEDEQLRVLFATLPANSHLRSLNLRGNRPSDACLREHALPALRANTGLRELWLDAFGAHFYDGDEIDQQDAQNYTDDMAELAALLAARGA
jgi:hypothetical protein